MSLEIFKGAPIRVLTAAYMAAATACTPQNSDGCQIPLPQVCLDTGAQKYGITFVSFRPLPDSVANAVYYRGSPTDRAREIASGTASQLIVDSSDKESTEGMRVVEESLLGVIVKVNANREHHFSWQSCNEEKCERSVEVRISPQAEQALDNR